MGLGLGLGLGCCSYSAAVRVATRLGWWRDRGSPTWKWPHLVRDRVRVRVRVRVGEG